MTYHQILTYASWRVILGRVKLSLLQVFSWVEVSQYLVICVISVFRLLICLSVCPYSFVHLLMEYIYFTWYDIPELVVHIMKSLIEVCCWKKRLQKQRFLVVFYGLDHAMGNRYGIIVSQMTMDIFYLS